MNTDYIEFKKKREIGEILTDTFAFLRQNIKSLFTILVKTSAIPFVLVLATLVYYMYATKDLFNTFGQQTDPDFFNMGSMMISLLLMFVSFAVFYCFFMGTILHYLKAYIENQGKIDQSEVIQGVKKDFWRILGVSILTYIIVLFGTLLCFFPGVYLYVPMSLVLSIMIFGKTSISDAISNSFELIKNEWWITFATLLVVGIITFIISLVFSIPSYIYSWAKLFTSASEGSMTDPSSLFDWVYITLTILGSAARYIIIYLVTPISVAFIYFNLNELKYATGALEQIDSLGNES